MQLTQEQIERWQSYHDAMLEDAEFVNRRHEVEQLRVPNLTDARNLLARYLDGLIDNESFRSEFQSKSVSDWRTFGLGGFSGAMFLNMIVNNIPDQGEVEKQLKLVLPVPTGY